MSYSHKQFPMADCRLPSTHRRFAGSPIRRFVSYRRAVTLLELMLAITIVAILSVAVTALLTGAGNTNAYVNNETQALSQVETAYRRIMHNIRTASTLVAPTNTTAATSLTVQTQPDPNNGNNPWTVTYKIVSGNLVEDDPRYNGPGNTPNILVSNVQTFTVTKSATALPTTIQLTIVSGTTPPVTRNATIDCRNF